jgi:hypothetical protein
MNDLHWSNLMKMMFNSFDDYIQILYHINHFDTIQYQ